MQLFSRTCDVKSKFVQIYEKNVTKTKLFAINYGVKLRVSRIYKHIIWFKLQILARRYSVRPRFVQTKIIRTKCEISRRYMV